LRKPAPLALALPETSEADHHGRPSFRVRGRIFATVPDQEHLRIMIDEGGIHAAAAEHPAACQAFSWGTRLAYVVVELAAIAPEQLAGLLSDTWFRNAAPALARPSLTDDEGRFVPLSLRAGKEAQAP